MSRRTVRTFALLIVPFVVLIAVAVYTQATLAGSLVSGAHTPTDPHVGPMPTGTPMPVCGQGWSIVFSNNGEEGNLNSISAISTDDVWAVGSHPNSVGRGATTMHWDGQTWTTVAVPLLETSNTELSGVAAVSTNDVWAVGSTDNHALIMH